MTNILTGIGPWTVTWTDGFTSYSQPVNIFADGPYTHTLTVPNGQTLTVDVPGPLTLDHIGLMANAAEAGLGIAYVPEQAVRSRIERGTLATVLDDWCPWIPGLCLYYPGHRHVPSGLRAFIEVLQGSR